MLLGSFSPDTISCNMDALLKVIEESLCGHIPHLDDVTVLVRQFYVAYIPRSISTSLKSPSSMVRIRPVSSELRTSTNRFTISIRFHDPYVINQPNPLYLNYAIRPLSVLKQTNGVQHVSFANCGPFCQD
jgi:hypothetical protein